MNDNYLEFDNGLPKKQSSLRKNMTLGTIGSSDSEDDFDIGKKRVNGPKNKREEQRTKRNAQLR